MGLAEYGGDELLIAFVACGSVGYLLSAWVSPWLAILPAIPLAIVLWFFRDPDRSGTTDEGVLLSPADGTVSDIEEIHEPDFFNGKTLRIGIFLSPFNVHVNRAPAEGSVELVKFKAGEFLPAYNPQAPTKNEAVLLGMKLNDGFPVGVKQVTGVLARRIICAVHPGDRLARGQRYGMIKFGSRTEVYVPLGCGQPLVKIGDKVLGGATELCRIDRERFQQMRRAEQVLAAEAAVVAAEAATAAPIQEATRA